MNVRRFFVFIGAFIEEGTYWAVLQPNAVRTTQDDLENGRLICMVGIAPPKPDEFVMFGIGQGCGN